MSTIHGQPRVVRFELSLKSVFVILGLLGGIWLVAHALPVLLVLVAALMLVGGCIPWLPGSSGGKCGGGSPCSWSLPPSSSSRSRP